MVPTAGVRGRSLEGPALARPRPGLDVEWLRTRGVSLVLATTFLVVTAARLAGSMRFDTIGIDARIYRLAAAAAMTGGDPWAQADVFRFAGTPPSLVLFVPTVLLSENPTVVLALAAFAVVGVLLVRRLELPLWWVLFPPLSESILTANEDVLVVWLLLVGGAWAGLAVVAKTYALVPLALQGRWGPVVVGVVLSLLLLPLWVAFFERRDEIARVLNEQADGGLSAWGAWWLFVPTLGALWGLRGRGASWLVVPALWPATQLHYSLLALPVARRSPLLAFLLCFANPLLPPIAVIAEFGRVRVVPWARAELARRRGGGA